MDAEAVIHGSREGSRITRGLHVHFGIADQDSFGRGGAEFTKNRLRAKRVGLLGFKAIAAVNGAKIFCEAKCFEDALADTYGLVRQNGYGERVEMFERFRNAGIRASRIHFVVFVVCEKEL